MRSCVLATAERPNKFTRAAESVLLAQCVVMPPIQFSRGHFSVRSLGPISCCHYAIWNSKSKTKAHKNEKKQPGEIQGMRCDGTYAAAKYRSLIVAICVLFAKLFKLCIVWRQQRPTVAYTHTQTHASEMISCPHCFLLLLFSIYFYTSRNIDVAEQNGT